MAIAFDAPATMVGTEPEPPFAIYGGPDDEKAGQDAAEPISEATTETKPTTDPIDAVNDELHDAAEVAREKEDDTFWDEIALLGELAEAERQCSAAEYKWSILKEDTKDAKKHFELKLLDVRMVASKITELIAGKTLPVNPNAPAAPGAGDEAPGASGEAPDVAVDDSWRAKRTFELLNGMKGLGQKKLDSICDACPTAGDLEELRGQASKEHKSFREVLPKGCGQTIADGIEELLLDLAVKGSQMSAADQVKLNRPATDEAAADELAGKIEEIRNRYKQEAIDAAPDDFAPEDPDDTDDLYVVGFNAFRAGVPVYECPAQESIPGQVQSHWLEGWLAGELIANWHGSNWGD